MAVLDWLKDYRKTTVDCVDHIVEVVKKSSTAGLNKAQRYDNGKGFQYLILILCWGFL